MPDFTPGPWYVDTARQVAGCNGDIAIVKDNGTLVAVAYARRRPDETLANACLIAAAPEMYEALKKVLEVYDPDPAVVPIRKILRKAEGKQKTGN